MKENFQLLMEEEIKKIESTGKKPVLLLQCCCAPCSSAVLERLKEHFKVLIYFYNPNIYPEEEYYKRLGQFDTLLNKTEYPNGIERIEAEYNQDDFFRAVKGLENEKEGGARCTECFKLRLGETARKAARKLGLASMSAQAAGGAVGRNPISLIVPCHRVIAKSGSLTGYAGGIEKKKWLLRLEETSKAAKCNNHFHAWETTL